MMRMAISPRLAIRIFLNRPDGKQGLPVLYGLSVLDQLAFQDSRGFRFDFVHQLHGFDDAQHFARLDSLANAHERRGARRGALVEGADDGRLYQYEMRIGRAFARLRGFKSSSGGYGPSGNRRRG